MLPKRPRFSNSVLGGLSKMLSLGLRTAKQTDTKHSDECVLLIEAEADDAARILDELSSATDERFHVEWVPDLSRGIERLRNGGVGAVVLDLTLPDSHGLETFDKLFQAAPSVPILILSGRRRGRNGEASRRARGPRLPGQESSRWLPIKAGSAHDDGSPCGGTQCCWKTKSPI